MFRHSSSASSAASYGSDTFVHRAACLSSAAAVAALPAVPTQIPRVAGGYIDIDGNNVSGGPFTHFVASSPPSYSSSLPNSSYYYNNIQRSISSHSLPLHLQQAADHLGAGGSAFFSSSSHHLPLPPLSSSPSSSSGDLFEFTSPCPVRRVFSTGDLQGMNGSSPPRPLPSGDSCGQDGGGPFSQKVGRYSAEERKERIERYRVKRHQRNFNKKITYACRKTLADSRPRVKGRFARNGEAEAEGDEREASDASYDYCGSGVDYQSSNRSISNGGGNNCYHRKDGGASNGAATAAPFAYGSDNGEWWWRAPGATAEAERDRDRERQAGFDVDEELWATLGDMLSVNLAS
ncbi:hypothetical protein GUJ93_ZPchr0007g6333 [Zizania palustris]|uniref:CCT domain-containing protein n=1 Tax=Zizania palustris TaxID=103762 RepID=A0A8J5TEQ6_ZIZPA|nr:hypothetical protein GUJ93_ZPchr0007g6333 [Zizania palustris]